MHWIIPEANACYNIDRMIIAAMDNEDKYRPHLASPLPVLMKVLNTDKDKIIDNNEKVTKNTIQQLFFADTDDKEIVNGMQQKSKVNSIIQENLIDKTFKDVEPIYDKDFHKEIRKGFPKLSTSNSEQVCLEEALIDMKDITHDLKCLLLDTKNQILKLNYLGSYLDTHSYKISQSKSDVLQEVHEKVKSITQDEVHILDWEINRLIVFLRHNENKLQKLKRREITWKDSLQDGCDNIRDIVDIVTEIPELVKIGISKLTLEEVRKWILLYAANRRTLLVENCLQNVHEYIEDIKSIILKLAKKRTKNLTEKQLEVCISKKRELQELQREKSLQKDSLQEGCDNVMKISMPVQIIVTTLTLKEVEVLISEELLQKSELQDSLQKVYNYIRNITDTTMKISTPVQMGIARLTLKEVELGISNEKEESDGEYPKRTWIDDLQEAYDDIQDIKSIILKLGKINIEDLTIQQAEVLMRDAKELQELQQVESSWADHLQDVYNKMSQLAKTPIQNLTRKEVKFLQTNLIELYRLKQIESTWVARLQNVYDNITGAEIEISKLQMIDTSNLIKAASFIKKVIELLGKTEIDISQISYLLSDAIRELKTYCRCCT